MIAMFARHFVSMGWLAAVAYFKIVVKR